jgi:hypothetical protein
MGRLVKSHLCLLLLLIGGICAHGQATEYNRVRLGLELYDAAHQGAHVRLTLRPRNKQRLEFAANLGYSLWRRYTYLGHVRGTVHGPYASVGLQWRLTQGGPGAWLLGGFVTYGAFGQVAKATIPNYYGDIVHTYLFKTSYGGLQLLLARSYAWRRWRLDGGLRISTCPRQYDDIAFHSYQPGIGRAKMWSARPRNAPSLLAYPFLALSFGLK